MKKLIGKRLAAAGLAVALVVSAVSVPNQASAAKAVKKVKVNKKKVTLYKGAEAGYGSIKIKASVTPKGAKAKFKWKSNKKKIATVNAKGLIKAKKPGKAVITVKAGKKSAKVKVTVKKIKKKVTKVTVASNKLTVAKGATAAIKASVAPSKATLKALTYTSSNKAVATVDAKGVVKGVKAGTATITVKAVDGSKKKATVTVTVTDAAVTPSKNPTPATTAPAPATTAPAPATTAPAPATTAPAATDKPTTAPTEEPAAPWDIEGNETFVLDSDSDEYTITANGTTLNTTDATVEYAYEAFAYALDGFADIFGSQEAWINKVIAPRTVQIADGVTVSVSKDVSANAWDYALKVGFSGVSDKVDGNYNVMVCPDGDGKYNIADADVNGKYYVSGNTWAGKSFILRFAETAAVEDEDGNQTITYDIDELSFTSGDDVKVYSTGADKTDNITVTVSSTEDYDMVTIVKGDLKAVIADTEDGYIISIPDEYVEKYGITVVPKE